MRLTKTVAFKILWLTSRSGLMNANLKFKRCIIDDILPRGKNLRVRQIISEDKLGFQLKMDGKPTTAHDLFGAPSSLCKGSASNFTSNIKQILAHLLTSIPSEINRKPYVV